MKQQVAVDSRCQVQSDYATRTHGWLGAL